MARLANPLLQDALKVRWRGALAEKKTSLHELLA